LRAVGRAARREGVGGHDEPGNTPEAGLDLRKRTARIATMVLATSRLSGLTRKKEGFVPFQRSVGRFGGRRGATGRSRA